MTEYNRVCNDEVVFDHVSEQEQSSSSTQLQISIETKASMEHVDNVEFIRYSSCCRNQSCQCIQAYWQMIFPVSLVRRCWNENESEGDEACNNGISITWNALQVLLLPVLGTLFTSIWSSWLLELREGPSGSNRFGTAALAYLAAFGIISLFNLLLIIMSCVKIEAVLVKPLNLVILLPLTLVSIAILGPLGYWLHYSLRLGTVVENETDAIVILTCLAYGLIAVVVLFVAIFALVLIYHFIRIEMHRRQQAPVVTITQLSPITITH